MGEFDYIKKYDISNNINNLASKYKDKRIILYGAGKFAQYLFENYDFSKLNIVAIADKKFETDCQHEFYNLNCVKPEELKVLNYDAIIVLNQEYGKFCNIISNLLTDSINQNADILPIIKTELPFPCCKDKVCKRPFRVATFHPDGGVSTCCPAYIKGFFIGNVLKQSFKNVWNGTRANFLRKSLLNNDYSLCDFNSCIQLDLADKHEVLNTFYDENNVIKMPEEIYMGWDYDCNVACITCRNKLIKNNEETLAKFKLIEKDVLDACKSANLFYASGNGDPFGSNYARNLIKKVAEINPNIKFFIHTNGILCTEKICCELGIKDRISNVVFSIHAACEDTYNKVVRFGNFNKVIENLNWISDLKSQGQIKTLTLAFVVQKFNYKDMPDFVKLAERFGAIASFRHYRQWGNNTEYKYEDMAVFEPTHPEFEELKKVLKSKEFYSQSCQLDKLLNDIRKN